MTVIISGTDGVSDVDGDASTPALRGTDANTGIFFGADQVGVATNGVERVEFGNSETVFNDGGADVDFRVEGDSEANLIFVDASTDRIGVGTSTPGFRTVIKQNSTGAIAQVLQLENNATIATGKGLKIGFGLGDNEGSTRGYIEAALDSSNGTYMAFATNDGLTGTFERVRINSSGGLILAGSTAQKATGTTWSNPSDERLKDNIRDYGKGIAELMQVRVREWEYNGKGGTVEGTKGMGVVADEVMVVLPDTVENYEAKLNADDEDVTAIKKFDATEITWLLVKTVQELKAINDAQAQTIESLTARVVALEAQ